jgi:8-oxo-dGTP diphosphatase
MVLNSRGEVLVVQEKSGPSVIPDFWKLPGGLVDAGEDLSSAAIREVYEETGIVTDFVKVAAIREHHAAAFGATDFYVICILKLAGIHRDEVSPVPRPQVMPHLHYLLQRGGGGKGREH